MTTVVLVGLGIAGAALATRFALRTFRRGAGGAFGANDYYKGGFEKPMSKKEAFMILGIKDSATKEEVKEAHRRIMLKNHPDNQGSSFISAKVNEAKDMIIKGKTNERLF